jgi:uroporphyrinogen-III decarboxylase
MRKIYDKIGRFRPVPFPSENKWVQKYLEFIVTYTEVFLGEYPVAQSFAGEPSDLACALLGAENAAIALLTEPEAMHNMLEFLTDQLEQLLKLQLLLSLLPTVNLTFFKE